MSGMGICPFAGADSIIVQVMFVEEQGFSPSRTFGSWWVIYLPGGKRIALGRVLGAAKKARYKSC